MSKRKFNQLTARERDLIAVWKSQGRSNKEIARKLNKHPFSIGREFKRNKFKDKHYVAIHAQAKAEQRSIKTRRRQPLKNPDVYRYVLQRLRCGWSPKQIAGRLKRNHPDDQHWQIHHETICQFIYSPQNQDKRLWEYLP
jgi:IS30 family transposase